MDVRLRYWDADEHLANVHTGVWRPMVGPDGAPLHGIDGKRGVRGIKRDGSHIGADFIRMQPGARFELHTHEGEHEIYFISGTGAVHIDGEDITVTGGYLIHIPAEYPHGVWVPPGMLAPLIFAAVGHPHHHVHAPDRMQMVEEDNGDQPRSVESGV